MENFTPPPYRLSISYWLKSAGPTLFFSVQVDMSRVFNAVMLQQTQPTDSQGHKTITAMYTTWYLETMLRRVPTGHIVFSPLQKAFVAVHHDGSGPLRPDDYVNLVELRALAEIIGPYGMKYFYETLTWNVASQISELKVRNNILADRIKVSSFFALWHTFGEITRMILGDGLISELFVSVSAFLLKEFTFAGRWIIYSQLRITFYTSTAETYCAPTLVIWPKCPAKIWFSQPLCWKNWWSGTSITNQIRPIRRCAIYLLP